MQRLFALRPGWEFCHADSGASALQSLDQTDPDLILLDLGLPDTHGLVVLNQLRGLARRRDCPVYVVSAQQDPAIKRALVGAGADGFFDKPVAVQAVLDLLDLLAGNRREQQA